MVLYRLSEGDANALKLSQLKRTGNKVLLKGGVLEDAITAAITAMNEPKTCSTTTLRRYLIDANKDKKEYQLGKRLLLSLLRVFRNGSFVWEQQIGSGLLGNQSSCLCLRYARLSTRWRRIAPIGPVCRKVVFKVRVSADNSLVYWHSVVGKGSILVNHRPCL